eukprot:IDg8169t1
MVRSAFAPSIGVPSVISPFRRTVCAKGCALVGALALVAGGTWRTRRHAARMATGSSATSQRVLLGGDGVLVNAPSGAASAAVIFLHGLGDSGDGWASAFPLDTLPHVRFLLPSASNIPVSLNSGIVMPSWFNLYGLDSNAPDDVEGIDAAVSRVDAIIAATGLPTERIVLAGFSQGGAVALTAALRSKYRLAGVVGMSSWLPRRADYPAAFGPHAKTTPFFVAHGTSDTVLPYAFGKSSADLLREHGVDVDFRTYPGLTHSASPKELVDFAAFLKNVLPPEST